MEITQEAINEITQIIKDECEPEKIILFGSYATGKADAHSDLDIIVVTDREKHLPRRKRGLKLLYDLRKYHFSKDILFYTKEEIDKWKEVPSAFITEAIRDGVLLYG